MTTAGNIPKRGGVRNAEVSVIDRLRINKMAYGNYVYPHRSMDPSFLQFPH
jgi:hypothetical protein